jgi:hypothetical protein
MAEVLIPPDIVPTEESVEIVDDSTAVFRPLFGGGMVQRAQQASPRIRVTQKWSNLRGSDLARMIAVCDGAQGRFGTVRAVVGYGARGTMPNTEWSTNNDFGNGTTGYSFTRSAGAAEDNTLTVISDGTSGTMDANWPTATPVASTAFCVRAFQQGLSGQMLTSSPSLVLKDNGGNVIRNEYLSSQLGEYAVAAAVASGANYRGANRFGIAPWSGTEYGKISWVSMRPCLMVQSKANIGESNVYAMCAPSSEAGVLLPGDWIEINGEVKRVIAPMRTTTAGYGNISFQPPLFATASVNLPIVTHQPMGKFILADNPKWTNKYGVYADLELTMEHIYEP